MRHVETIIVGGGPAGSSCAAELVRGGRECLILDRKTFPRPKLCAGWITPRVLADLGIRAEDYAHGILELEKIKVVFGRRHRFCKTVATEQYSIRRVEFDDWLLKRFGAEIVRHTVRRIARASGGYVIDGQFRCRQLVGAGGTTCPVKKGLFPADRGRLVVTQEVEYECVPRSSLCTLWLPFACPFGYAWYVPKVGAVNIGFGGPHAQLAHWDRRKLWQEFLALLRREGCIDGEPPEPKGHPYYIGNRGQLVKRDHAYLVGDAAGLATLDLAEGIGPAIASGQLAARDILGRETYSTARITRYSLGVTARWLRAIVAMLP